MEVITGDKNVQETHFLKKGFKKVYSTNICLTLLTQQCLLLNIYIIKLTKTYLYC